MNIFFTIISILLLILILTLVLTQFVYGHCLSHRVVCDNGVYKSQKSRRECNSWGDDWIVWVDMKTHETRKEAIDYVKNIKRTEKALVKKNTFKVERYFFK